MEKKKNFLDVLQEEFDSFLEQGLIDEETLKNGVTIDFKNLLFTDINGSNMARTLGKILKEINPSYEKNSMFSINQGNTVTREHRYNPDTITRFALKKNTNGKMYIEVNGKDNWTKYFITNDKNPDSRITELSPEEFLEKYADTERDFEGFKIKKRLSSSDVSLSSKDIVAISECIYTSQKNNVLMNGLNISFNEMMHNFGEYCKYLLDPNLENYRDILDKQKEIDAEREESKIIQGGIISQREDTGFARKSGKGGRKH